MHKGRPTTRPAPSRTPAAQLPQPPGTAPARARGRPRDASKRTAIVRSAQALFMAQGYNATSMDAIAERAGVSKLTLYNQFGSKQDIFEAAVGAKCAEMLAPLEVAEARRMSPRRALIAIGQTFLGLVLSPEAISMYRLLAQEQCPELSGLFYRTAIVPTAEQVAAILAGLRDDAGLAFDDPMQAACDYLDLLKGRPFMCALMGLPGLSRSELESHVDHCADLMLRAWRAGPRISVERRARRRARPTTKSGTGD
jgi:TetR/AcrR family transcriptional repressor of mexJK operon